MASAARRWRWRRRLPGRHVRLRDPRGQSGLLLARRQRRAQSARSCRLPGPRCARPGWTTPWTSRAAPARPAPCAATARSGAGAARPVRWCPCCRPGQRIQKPRKVSRARRRRRGRVRRHGGVCVGEDRRQRPLLGDGVRSAGRHPGRPRFSARARIHGRAASPSARRTPARSGRTRRSPASAPTTTASSATARSSRMIRPGRWWGSAGRSRRSSREIG